MLIRLTHAHRHTNTYRINQITKPIVSDDSRSLRYFFVFVVKSPTANR